MRTFEPITLNLNQLADEVDELADFLASHTALKEREQVAPFFKSKKQLCAALSLTNSSVELPDRVAVELDLFGDFACDVASGDSSANAFTLVEFEDAQECSVLGKLERGKTMKRWAPRFERGFSQLVDWAWRLHTEGGTTDAYHRIFGANNANVHLLLIAGRDTDLRPEDHARIRWRANNTSLGGFRTTCMTFDGVLNTLRRRLTLVANTAPLISKSLHQ
jgi:Domain of unknown function (DUF4263)